MRRIGTSLVTGLGCVLAVRCAATSAGSSAAIAPEPITPADFVASIADVAAGRNAAMAEAGLILKRIEFKLAVGQEIRGGGKIEVLLLEAEASRRTETAFLQEFAHEVPAGNARRAAPKALVPGVRDFIDAAMNTARSGRGGRRRGSASANQVGGAHGEDHAIPEGRRRHRRDDPGLGEAVHRPGGRTQQRGGEHREAAVRSEGTVGRAILDLKKAAPFGTAFFSSRKGSPISSPRGWRPSPSWRRGTSRRAWRES